MAKAENPVVRELDSEYELAQLNPQFSPAEDGKPSYNNIEALAKKLPETAHMKMRVATFEAIVETIAEKVIEDADGEVLVEKIEDSIEPVVEKAIALHLIPAYARQNVKQVLAKYYKNGNPLVKLHSKVAHRIANSVVRMEEEDCVVAEVLEDLDPGQDLKITEETTVVDNRKVEVDEIGSESVEASLRYIAASAVNHRKATAIATRQYAGAMVNTMHHELRNVLPAWYKELYQVR